MKQVFKITQDQRVLLYKMKDISTIRDKTYIWNILLSGEYTESQRKTLNLKRERYLNKLIPIYKSSRPTLTKLQQRLSNR